MACKNCTSIVIEECEESLCDGTVSLPCDFVIPASCVKNTTALPNLGNCKEVVSDYVCSDLGTILKAIDDQLTNCGVDTFVESGVLSGGTLTLTLNDETEVDIDLSALVNATQFWARNSGSGYLYPTTLTDKVGVGVNTPTHKLHVVGDFLARDTPAINSIFNISNGLLSTNATLYNGAKASALHHKKSTTGDSLIFVVQDYAILTTTNTSGSFNATIQADIVGASPLLTLSAVDGASSTVLVISDNGLTIDGAGGWSGTFTSGTGTTVTVTKGIITNVA
jgi:hypothetical protein